MKFAPPKQSGRRRQEALAEFRIPKESRHRGGEAVEVSTLRLPPSTFSGEAGFTMVEIVLCLAIIGFALVAIIGVLPTGLNVQKDNREETIINQDDGVWMNSIRNGAQGYDDLPNYVIAITNTVWSYTIQNGVAQPDGSVTRTALS